METKDQESVTGETQGGASGESEGSPRPAPEPDELLQAVTLDVCSHAAEWISNFDHMVAGGGSIGRDTKALYGSTRQLIADLLAVIQDISALSGDRVVGTERVLQPEDGWCYCRCHNGSDTRYQTCIHCDPSPAVASPLTDSVSADSLAMKAAEEIAEFINEFTEWDGTEGIASIIQRHLAKSPDYIAGWEAGRKAAILACEKIAKKYGDKSAQRPANDPDWHCVDLADGAHECVGTIRGLLRPGERE